MFRWIKTMLIEVAEKSKLYFLINAFIGAYNRRTDAWEALQKPIEDGGSGDNSGTAQALTEMNNRLDFLTGQVTQLTTIVNNFEGKVDSFMSTQEERLRGVKTKLDAIQSGVDKIQQQLADLKANNPDLDDEISAIEETAAAIDTDVNPVVEPTPTEPNP